MYCQRENKNREICPVHKKASQKESGGLCLRGFHLIFKSGIHVDDTHGYFAF